MTPEELQTLQQEVAELRQLVNDMLAPGMFLFRKDTKIGINGTGVTVAAKGGKVGLFGTTPIVQQTPTGESTMLLTSGVAAKNDSSWSGGTGTTFFTVGDIVKILKAHGLLKA